MYCLIESYNDPLKKVLLCCPFIHPPIFHPKLRNVKQWSQDLNHNEERFIFLLVTASTKLSTFDPYRQWVGCFIKTWSAPSLRYSKRDSLLKSFLYFHIPGDICLYSFTVYLVFLVFFSTRFLFTQLEFENDFFFFHNNWMLYLISLAATLLQLKSLKLWKALKNKSELSFYKTDIFLICVFCPEWGLHCSDL